MEILGGFMVLLWMAGFFLAVIWFILPFVIFSIKGRTEEILQRIEQIEHRLTSIENAINTRQQPAENCNRHLP